MKNVLLLVHADEGQEARLQAALDICRALDGHLTCLDVTDPAPAIDVYAPAADQVAFYQEEVADEAANRQKFEQRLVREDVRWNMLQATGRVADCVLEHARQADLILLSCEVPGAAIDLAAIAREVVFKSRKPVMAVGSTKLGLDLYGSALIAWDGSEAAMAAVTAAVPLLQSATTVRILEVGVSERDSTAEEVATYLSRHGMRPSVHRVGEPIQSLSQRMTETFTGGIALEISRNCSAFDVEYCVMGAFGHSPRKEAIFGGTTRDMLALGNIPLFLAH